MLSDAKFHRIMANEEASDTVFQTALYFKYKFLTLCESNHISISRAFIDTPWLILDILSMNIANVVTFYEELRLL
jgi:hypothetical protein